MTPKRVKVASILCSCLIQLLKVSPKSSPSRSNSAFPPFARLPHRPKVCLGDDLGEQKKRFFTGNLETGKSFFFPSFSLSLSRKGSLLLVFRGEHNYLKRKIENFASISQVTRLSVICVLNLKLDTAGYGRLIPESAGKEHFGWFLAGLSRWRLLCLVYPEELFSQSCQEDAGVCRTGRFLEETGRCCTWGALAALPSHQPRACIFTSVLLWFFQLAFSTRLHRAHILYFRGTGWGGGNQFFSFSFNFLASHWTSIFISRVAYVQSFWLDPARHFSAIARAYPKP